MIDQLIAAAGQPGRAFVLAAEARRVAAGMPIEELMLGLIPAASAFSRPALSGFQVGAVAEGASGALYFGANYEFSGGPLSATIHAEQSAIVNAMLHGETAVVRLAVSAAPCGYCRQFLAELASADRLQILLAGKPPRPFLELLPGAFGPGDLGVASALLAPSGRVLNPVGAVEGPVARAALDAAARSYVPYTHAAAGVALGVAGGAVFAGPCVENAAFNPSLSPMQTAILAAVLGGIDGIAVTEAVLVRLEGSSIDHAAPARALLAKFAPAAALLEATARVAPTTPKGGRV